MGPRIRRSEHRRKRRSRSCCRVAGLGEDPVAGRTGGGIEVPQEDCRQVLGNLHHPRQNQLGAFFLHRLVEVKVRVDGNKSVPFAFENADGALARPPAFGEPARDIRGVAQKKMLCMRATPGRLKKNHVVLPEIRRRRAAPDDPVLAENFAKKIDLESIGLLEGDQVGAMGVEQRSDSRLSKPPAVRPVVCEAKAEVEAHHRDPAAVVARRNRHLIPIPCFRIFTTKRQDHQDRCLFEKISRRPLRPGGSIFRCLGPESTARSMR